MDYILENSNTCVEPREELKQIIGSMKDTQLANVINLLYQYQWLSEEEV